MSESQPDMLGGKAVPGSRLRRGRSAAPIARNAWADKPGSGPAGETCGSCTFCETYHYAKTYRKCAARPGHHWKGGRSTDIRPLDPACSKWSARANHDPGQPIPAAGADPRREDRGSALQSSRSAEHALAMPDRPAATKVLTPKEDRQYAFAL